MSDEELVLSQDERWLIEALRRTDMSPARVAAHLPGAVSAAAAFDTTAAALDEARGARIDRAEEDRLRARHAQAMFEAACCLARVCSPSHRVGRRWT